MAEWLDPWRGFSPHHGATDPKYGQAWIWKRRKELYRPGGKALLACGPRYGKDILSTALNLTGLFTLLAKRLRDKANLVPLVHSWVVAPSTGDFEQVWREYRTITAEWPRKVYDATGRQKLILLPQDPKDPERTGITIEFISGWHPERIVGVGLDSIHKTEWALFKPETDQSLDDRKASPGRIGYEIANGTPTLSPSRRYRAAFKACRDDMDTRTLFLNAPTWENPHLSVEQLEELREVRKSVSERRWRAFQGAELLAEGAALEGLRECSTAAVQNPQPGARYLKCYDPAGFGSDYNVISVFRYDGAHWSHMLQVNLYRYQSMRWEREKGLLRRIMDSYPGELHYDANGRLKLGGMLKDIRPHGERIVAHTWSKPVKASMVDRMERVIGDQGITLLHPDASPQAKAQFEELEEFDLDTLNAPEGGHDDTVTGVFMALEALEGRGRPGAKRRVAERLGAA